ncbi:hypothetical protein, partial [Enterococcus avium]|uniref:hypothetical protein n=1 Tax=Enterococcus avium TaxID=33945 RepID=UPI003D0CA88B
SSEAFEKSTPISIIPYDYFQNAQKIDVHNHRRQGILALERSIHTQNWVVRIISTILGMIMVDAYMMYLLEKRRPNHEGIIPNHVSFNSF